MLLRREQWQPDLGAGELMPATPGFPGGGAAPRIEDHALIGDGQTAALVTRGGVIDWLCWPRFDSPACFAALLGGPENGYWRIAPVAEVTSVTRAYRPGTMILETLFETADGSVALIDFMPPGQTSIVRIVEARGGVVPMRFELALRFGYGASVPWVTRPGGELTVHAVAGPDQVTIRPDVRLHGEGLTTAAVFSLQAGQRAGFAMRHAASTETPPVPPDPNLALARTEAEWTAWSARCTYHGVYGEPVLRSLLTLKSLAHRQTGGIVAAPTTSLPEHLGGERNWDYRYCWPRDAAFSFIPLMRSGFREEAAAWSAWLRRAVAGTPSQLQPIYGLAGERWLPEHDVPWLAGHAGSRPVRVGNAASAQFQLDIFGEVMDVLHQQCRLGLTDPRASWDLRIALTEHLETIWTLPDEGIWEVRGPRRHFTFSKIMAWVAFDRMVRDAADFGLPGPIDRWRGARAEIHAAVCHGGFSPRRNSFTQSFGDEALDAALLLLPSLGFLPPDDPRVRGTVEAIGRDLMVDGLVQRYRSEAGVDGLPPGEGAFLACSFWYVDSLVLQGRQAEARAMFERLLGMCNDVGLLAEEYDPVARRQLGNFPQAFSHLALINTALNLGV